MLTSRLSRLISHTMAASVNTTDILIFGALTLFLQLACYRIADFLIRDLPRRIVDGEISAAILLASIKLSVGAINAAAVGG